MIRATLMLGFWAVLLPIAALTCFPWVLITGDIRPLYEWACGARGQAYVSPEST
jgi:hypothetical protein